MTIACEWLVLAERVIEDAYTGNLTIVSCMEDLIAPMFPAVHNGFAVAARYRWIGVPPRRNRRWRIRLVRCSEHDGEEVVAEDGATWEAGRATSRWVIHFRMLRLRRPETLTFRMDHKVGRSAWQRGPSVTIEVRAMDSDATDQPSPRDLLVTETTAADSEAPKADPASSVPEPGPDYGSSTQGST